MKKRKNLLRSALALLLAAAALSGPLALPASHTRADGDAEFDYSGTAFTEPQYDTAMMYFWHEGIPAVTKDKNGDYIRYPLLSTWEDKYYLRGDMKFKGSLTETHQYKKNTGHLDKISNSTSDTSINGYKSYKMVDHCRGGCLVLSSISV